MSIALIPNKEVECIVNSFHRVFSTGDINKLTHKAYRFINLSSGFIAHFNVHGFRENYRDVEYFKGYILKMQKFNQWNNFFLRDANYGYYMQKKEIYNRICQLIA